MLVGFTAALMMVTAAELGDKTFFITLCLAMRHQRRWVFLGSIAALAAMTILSVAMGQVLAQLPKAWTDWAVVMLFLFFGLKLLYDASKMSPSTTGSEAEQLACAEIEREEAKFARSTPAAIMLEAFTLTFLAEWGDRTQFTTISLAAKYNVYAVTFGAILGHAICAAIAVIGGKLVAGRLSEKTITLIGGLLFLIFAAISYYEIVAS